MRIWTDDTEWYIAADLEDLEAVILEHNGNTYEEMVGEPAAEAFHEVPGDQAFQMHFPDEDEDGARADSPPGAVLVLSSLEHPIFEASFQAWVDFSGRGFLASTEY